MNWKDIIKAPFDYRRRNAAKRAGIQGQSELRETEPKEDLSTDISTFASKYIDSQYKRRRGSGRAFVTKNPKEFSTSGISQIANNAWKPFLALIQKYGEIDLEKKLGELYNAHVEIERRGIGQEREMYYITLVN